MGVSNILVKKQVSVQQSIQSNFFHKKCKNLLKNIPEIRFVGLLDPMGNQVAGGFRSNVKPLKNLQDRMRMNIEAVLRVKTRQDFDNNLGPVLYCASRRSKVVMMSFLIGDYVLLISANSSVEIDETARKIMDLWGIRT